MTDTAATDRDTIDKAIAGSLKDLQMRRVSKAHSR